MAEFIAVPELECPRIVNRDSKLKLFYMYVVFNYSRLYTRAIVNADVCGHPLHRPRSFDLLTSSSLSIQKADLSLYAED